MFIQTVLTARKVLKVGRTIQDPRFRDLHK